jgi:hypothetical protein
MTTTLERLTSALGGAALFVTLTASAAAQAPSSAPSSQPSGAAPPPAAPDTCAAALTSLTSAQTQAVLDPLLAEFDAKPSDYQACALEKPRQLARIRVGRNELVGILRSVSLATTEADLGKWRDAALARSAQVEDAYVQLMGASQGGSLTLSCAPTPKEAEQGGALSRPTFAFNVNSLPAIRTQQTKDVTSEEITTAQNQTCEARQLATSSVSTAHARRLASSNLCGGFDADGSLSRYCITYGAFAAAISAVEFLDKAPDGLKNGRLLSVLVPYAGLRIPTQVVPYLSFDFTLYSAYITTGSIDTTPAPTPCGGGSTALLRNLPCEANPKIQPYAAFLAGVTLGQNNVGYLTLAPLTVGYARVGSQGVHPYIGVLAGTLQLTGKF